MGYSIFIFKEGEISVILAFTGAGISKDSGISTFMERPEIRDRLTRSFATNYPDNYRQLIIEMSELCRQASPNDAHYALFDYDIPIITMNIDELHERAGSTPLLLHGSLPHEEHYNFSDQLFNQPVLYGDPAPNYQKAYQLVNQLQSGDTLLVIGASRFTGVAVEIREIAYANNANIIEIQEDASFKVRETLENIRKK